jgi:hypothetical protein
MRLCCRGISFELPSLAFDLMEQERPIDALPQIVVLHRDNATKTLPLPIISPPFGHPES